MDPVTTKNWDRSQRSVSSIADLHVVKGFYGMQLKCIFYSNTFRYVFKFIVVSIFVNFKYS